MNKPNIDNLLSDYVCFDFETKDPYIGDGLGGGWVYHLLYSNCGDSFPVSCAVYDKADNRMEYYHNQVKDHEGRIMPHGYLGTNVINRRLSDCGTYVGHNLQYDLGWLIAQELRGSEDPKLTAKQVLRNMYLGGNLLIDTKILARLYNEWMISYSLKDLAKKFKVSQKNTKILADAVFVSGLYTHVRSSATGKNFKNRPKGDKGDNALIKMSYSYMHNLPVEVVREYCQDDVRATCELYEKLMKELSSMYGEEELLSLIKKYSDLQYCVLEMRIEGMTINNTKLKHNYKKVSKEIIEQRKLLISYLKDKIGEVQIVPTLEKCISTPEKAKDLVEDFKTRLYSDDINSISTSGSGKDPLIMFIIDGYKELDFNISDAGNASMNEEFLSSQSCEVAKMIKTIRKLEKLQSAFLGSLMNLQDKTGHSFTEYGVCHGEFNIYGTQTGRFSATNPNLQQIPKRDPDSYRLCRSLFVGGEDKLICASDFSNQEQRIQVHFGTLLGAKGAAEIASSWIADPLLDFHQKVADICLISRKEAKAINLGKSYGMGEAKLCQSLGLPTEIMETSWGLREVAGPEGKEIIEQYKQMLPFIDEATNIVRSVMSDRGFIKTLGGRHCRPETFFTGKKKVKKNFKAFSQLIQGSAADQLIKSMVDFYDYTVLNQIYDVNLCAVVHDEMVFKIPEDNWEHWRDLIVKIMEGSYKLEVPMVAEASVNKSWYEGE